MELKRIVLGVTGGVAAYKAAELARLLVKDGLDVQGVMSEAARHFVGAATFQAITGHPVFTDLWDERVDNGMAHIDLTRGADAILVAPAAADFLAKLVHGRADDLLSTLCLARDCPLLVAPAMNRRMWEAPATQRNIAQLAADGVTVLGPDSGEQACGEIGFGRMLEPFDLLDALEARFQPKRLTGLKVLITAGPTFEAIDAVRGITNPSSGKMGYAVARAAIEAGAEVTLISGRVCLAPPREARFLPVVSAQDMLQAVESVVDTADIFIAVAAVADYYVLNPSEQKIKKDAHILTLELAPNPDILASISARPKPPFCVGFAAESENLEEYAELKRRRKHLPLIVANDVKESVGSDTVRLILLDEAGHHVLEKADKRTQARKLVAHIAELYNTRYQ
ncbi:MAG: bifunctional phosphopantothenoylcysteine decarboxylase/phosphopantothenate--cysteine ligase CoaBC [Hydrogenophilales bacterium CG17_big_fil_post_rev_8_21_14_2_50_63_12]|nr:MAG: bifunctional phosphopantothenoylcysteine decarboxylase/phosphopantothenate--cysteine ligase CoaBC [Hydrogenophilales bacterium CG17_big_fil_post_rev_8_21_14_2_50_63_12]PIX96746.1 MAG: bifunctional phosphopantothenoylcysteine decarboxylase/phosphopantothenate--cysteine ligase CoaBC [Hydrogenophilales bacterium CG_4_10_14_3_um_filter_63_21]PJB02679.1 MAG: bifunctional phosphopantothenoylcysteine decarboxylase/phosphopantothenate--cysteine ligase CoaBC [Hydrogenophilales bacterium CG_4_9_14_